jgi:mono/diheme cytochrome c family protein
MLSILAAAAAALGFAAFWLLSAPQRIAPDALGPHAPDLRNGEVLFYAGNCAACHARPGQPDPKNLGGGLAMESPPGTFYVPNISPDPDDGIGRWTEADFVTALHKGTSPDGRHYYPAFPYRFFQRINTDDARDLFAFIKTLAPVRGRAPAHNLPFPFDWRRPLGLWKLLFLDEAPFQSDPQKSPQWNRGAYLANGPDHCAACHGSRNMFGAVKLDQGFAGAPNIEGQGWVPNITQARLSGWSEQDIARLITTGERPDGERVGSAMTAVIQNLARLSQEDRDAIATYIKSLPPVSGPARPDGK